MYFKKSYSLSRMGQRESDRSKKGKLLGLAVILFIALTLMYLFSGKMLRSMGEFLVLTEEPIHADAIVVLYTGVDYYPRLVEAAALYRKGVADQVVINGNRKNDALREFEREGFIPCCFWYEDTVRMLDVLGVPKDRVMVISAEDVYDTVSEAEAIGGLLTESGMSSLIITTSKFHSRRAAYIWRHVLPKGTRIRMVAAQSDPYTPDAWWKNGRQIRWVLTEYGSWLYYFWKTGGHVEN